MSSKRELLPPFSSSTPAVVLDDDDEGDEADAVGDPGERGNKIGGLVAATHAVSFLFFFTSASLSLQDAAPVIRRA